MSFKGCSGVGEGRKDKGGGERLCVKVCEKIVCMYVCMYVRTYVRMYVCVCVCVWQSCAWKMVCVKVTWVRHQCRHLFFANAAMSSARHAASLRTWNGLNEVCHDLLCSMWCNEMFYVTAAPVLQPRIRRWWHRGKVPGRKSVEHECSWLSMQLWKTSTERMPVKSRHSLSGKHHGYDANCAVFSHICQPHAVWLRLGSLHVAPSHSFSVWTVCVSFDGSHF